MKREEIFEAWAPVGRPWSNWVKPVLFANMDIAALYARSAADAAQEVTLPWTSAITARAAIVIDVPSSSGVAIGLMLAELGYQPVPLYNAAPGPTERLATPLIPGLAGLPISMVDMHPVVEALWFGAQRMKRIRLPVDCAPAFLLDSRRRTGEGSATAGRFDNRSVSFPTDFPSASFLQSQQIRHAVLVQFEGGQPQSDLAHTLLRWQEGGIAVSSVALNTSPAPVPIRVIKPSYFRWIWYRLLATFGLRRHQLGGFGGLIPEASAG